MPLCLEKLSSYLREYKIVINEFMTLEREKINLLTKKGVFPYEYLGSWKKLNETELPDKKKFYNVLNNSSISDEDYGHAQKVVTGCTSL